MNKKERVDDLLKFWRDILEENPQIDFSDPERVYMIYYDLLHLGVSKEEENKKISYFFANWVNQFPNFHPGELKRDQYFCQFASSENQFHTTRDSIKIYLPQDLDHIDESVKELLNFLQDYHIPHITNVASQILSDDIIIRLLRPEDADLVNRFIQNSEHIQKGLMGENPFAFSRNGLSYVNDGKLSFLKVVANYIRLYLSQKQRTNTVSEIGVDDFYQFVQSYYEETLENFSNIDRVMKDFAIDGRSPRNTSEIIVGHQNITELILKANQDGFTYEGFLNHVSECQDDAIQEKKIATVSFLRNPNPKKLTKEEINQVRSLLLQALHTMANKYGKDAATIYIREYIRRGDPTFLTRDHGLRDLLTNVNFRDTILSLLAEQKISLKKYMASIEEVKKPEEKDIPQNKEEKENIPDSELEKTTLKIMSIMGRQHNLISAINSLKLYLETNEPTYLTRNYGLRETITQSDFREKMLTQLNKEGCSFNDYASRLVNQRKLESYQKEALEKAVSETYKAKQELFEAGALPSSGEEFIKFSLKRFLITGEYNSFTRKNGAREEAIAFLTPQDAIAIMRTELKFPIKEECTGQERELLSENYAEMLIQKILQEKNQKNF